MLLQVNDSMAKQDAVALYCFLLNRGYILPERAGGELPVLPSPLPALIRDATPLTGVDMIKVRLYVCMHGGVYTGIYGISIA